MNVTRRDILKLVGGSALGMIFTPVPWKLLDDSSIWTQNWSIIPKVPRGPVSFRYSTCTLCPGGCALKARCVSNIPVSLSGVPNHPLSKGVLCPIGLGGHHLAYHPLRLTQPMRFVGAGLDGRLSRVSYKDAIAGISLAMLAATSAEAVAILDQRPWRAISNIYQDLLSALPHGQYLVPPSRECTTATRLQELTGKDGQSLGFDFEHCRTVLNFGTPLLDGWGTPGRMLDVFDERKPNRPALIHVESLQSRTALRADTWLPINPGTELVLALGIANVILAEHLYPSSLETSASDFADYRKFAAEFTPEVASRITDINATDIIATARRVARNTPSIVIAGCDPGGGPLGKSTETAIAGLNLLLGNVGRQGGVVERREMPGSFKSKLTPQQLSDVPDHSIRLLIVDGAQSGYAFPWKLVERKLIPEKAVVVSLSPCIDELTVHAEYIIPTPAHLESVQDVVNPTSADRSTYSISSALLPSKEGTTSQLEFIRSLAKPIRVQVPDEEAMLKERVQAIFASKRGVVFSSTDDSTKPVTDFSSPDDLWTVLNNAGVWIDGGTEQKPPQRVTLLGNLRKERDRIIASTKTASSASLVLMPVGWRAAIASGQMSPVMSKLFQESDLRHLAGRARINPLTGNKMNIEEGDAVKISTNSGVLETTVHLDSSVRPDVVVASVGPLPNGVDGNAQLHAEGVLVVCDISEEGTWRVTPATIEKV